MVNFSKAFDRIDISLLPDNIMESDLPGQIIALTDSMGKNTSVCTSYGRQFIDEWNVMTGVRLGGISSGILINFYLDEVISDISRLPAGNTSNCSILNILGYDHNLVLVAPTAKALQLLLNALNSKLYTLSLQVNVQKSRKIVFKHGNKKVSTSLTRSNQPLKKVKKTTYLGLVFTDDIFYAKDVERAKLAFFQTI